VVGNDKTEIMTTLIYITHPSVNIDKTVLPQNWDLSEKGIMEAKKLLDKDFWKEVVHIYTSDEPKAITTSKIITEKFTIPIESIAELGEADRTKTPFLPFEEYMKAIKDAYSKPEENIHGWESHDEMMQRNVKVLKELMSKHEGETFVIIGHGGAGTTMKCFIKGIEPKFEEDPKQTGCYFIADLDQIRILEDWTKY
jgi:broad specificity phosphatase PhoE